MLFFERDGFKFTAGYDVMGLGSWTDSRDDIIQIGTHGKRWDTVSR